MRVARFFFYGVFRPKLAYYDVTNTFSSYQHLDKTDTDIYQCTYNSVHKIPNPSLQMAITDKKVVIPMSAGRGWHGGRSTLPLAQHFFLFWPSKAQNLEDLTPLEFKISPWPKLNFFLAAPMVIPHAILHPIKFHAVLYKWNEYKFSYHYIILMCNVRA